MSKLFKSFSGRMGQIAKGVLEIFDSEDPIIILPYRGYANQDHFFIMGRVLENENIFHGKTQSEIRNIINSFKRFETDEIAGAKIQIQIQGQSFTTESDDEGYFTFHEKIDLSQIENLNSGQWLSCLLNILEPNKTDELPPGITKKDIAEKSISAEGEIYIPAQNASFGIITDVDDTILQTHMNSFLKLKMMYATFIQDGKERLPMPGIEEVMKKFSKGEKGTDDNPVFYVSNSPWNLYDVLIEFMEVHNLPKGPLMLRDFGINPSGPFKTHKMERISHIIKSYPKLKFILLGDTASKDADHYIELAHNFPNQIDAIYIRHTKDTKNAKRVAQLIESSENIHVHLITSSDDILNHLEH